MQLRAKDGCHVKNNNVSAKCSLGSWMHEFVELLLTFITTTKYKYYYPIEASTDAPFRVISVPGTLKSMYSIITVQFRLQTGNFQFYV